MAINRPNSSNSKILFVGVSKTGKKELLQRIKNLPILPLPYKNYYDEYATPITISLDDALNDLNKNYQNSPFSSLRFVFCVIARDDLSKQFDAIKKILQYYPKKPYWIYVYGIGGANWPSFNKIVFRRIERYLKPLSPDLGRPQILLCSCNDRELESFVQATLDTNPVNANVEEQKQLEQTHRVIPSYCTEFDRLDNTDVSGFSPLEIKILKNSMSKAVENILEKISEDIGINTNLDSYNEYNELFDKVTNSKILSAHNSYPTLDRIFRKKLLGTQQKLLGMIRADALDELRSKVNEEGVNQADLLQTINDAKTKPIFNMHRSNLPSFFRPDQTNAFKSLGKLAGYVVDRIQNIARVAV